MDLILADKRQLQRAISDSEAKTQELEYQFSKLLTVFEGQIKDREVTDAKKRDLENAKNLNNLRKFDQLN
jgi:hypothetical protein